MIATNKKQYPCLRDYKVCSSQTMWVWRLPPWQLCPALNARPRTQQQSHFLISVKKKLSFNVGLHLYPCPYFYLHPYHISTILYLPVVPHEAVPEASNGRRHNPKEHVPIEPFVTTLIDEPFFWWHEQSWHLLALSQHATACDSKF